MVQKDYIRWLREKVGHDLVFLNFAGGCIRNERGRSCCREGRIGTCGASPAAPWNWGSRPRLRR